MSRSSGLMLVCLLAFVGVLFGQVPKQEKAPADNTKVNQRDRNSAKPTADQQKGTPSDVEITRKIRQSLTRDKGLSTYGKNIKVVTQNGNVTLRGPVRSEEEKKSIEAKATEVAGASHVKSEIQIAAKQPQKKNP